MSARGYALHSVCTQLLFFQTLSVLFSTSIVVSPDLATAHKQQTNPILTDPVDICMFGNYTEV